MMLVLLLFCHYLADFCLTTPAMIRAKADGRTYGPILLHAGIHAALIGSCLLVYGTPCLLLLSLVLLELVSHFLIDTGKGHLTARFPKLAEMQNKPYWMLYGFDQLLHLSIIVAIGYGCGMI